LSYKLSASGTVVLCSDQKFTNVNHKKNDIKIDIAIFSNIESKSIKTFKKQNRDHTTLNISEGSFRYLWLAAHVISPSQHIHLLGVIILAKNFQVKAMWQC